MQARTIVLLANAALTPAAFGQSPTEQNANQVFRFTQNESAQDIQEISTLIRAIADLPQAFADTGQQTLSIEGTATQIAVAKWLFTQLDKPIAQQSQDQTIHEYRMPGDNDDVVRVLYAPYTPTLRDFQEVATLIRSTALIRRYFTYNAPRAMVLRGTTALRDIHCRTTSL